MPSGGYQGLLISVQSSITYIRN